MSLSTATTMEPPPDILQRTEMSSGGSTEQLEGKSHTVQQAKKTGQFHQSGKFSHCLVNHGNLSDSLP